MSQFGIQMPGARVRRASSPDVYTVLVVTAAVFLIVAAIIMYGAGSKFGPNGNAFGLQQPGNIQLQVPANR